MNGSPKLARWSLIILVVVTCVSVYFALPIVVGLLFFAALAGGIIPLSFVVPIMVLLIPIILGSILYYKKRYLAVSVLSFIIIILLLSLTILAISITQEARQVQIVRENTHQWNYDWTIGRIIEDCDRSQNDDFVMGLKGTGSENACYYQFATKDLDKSICGNITDTSLRNECLVEVKVKRLSSTN